MATNESKHEIDFLPQVYREKSQLRQRKASRYGVVAVFVLLLGVATLWQFQLKRSAQQQVDELRPLVAQTESQSALLAAAQTNLSRVESEARLFSYLEHPWPTTQLFAAATADLPAGVTLTELRVEHPTDMLIAQTFDRRAVISEDEAAAEEQPAPVRDLAEIRQTRGRLRPAIRLQGTTSSAAAIHQYIDLVANSPLIDRAELENLSAEETQVASGESAGFSPRRFTFEATLFVRPPHSHPLRKIIERPTETRPQIAMGNES